MFLFPKPVFFTHVKEPSQAAASSRFRRTCRRYGKVYHTASAQTELDMLNKEGGLVWQTHPRTKAHRLSRRDSRQGFLPERSIPRADRSNRLPVDLSREAFV